MSKLGRAKDSGAGAGGGAAVLEALIFASPEAVAHGFAQALLSGDARAAAACFDTGGLLVTADGTEVFGQSSIAVVLGQITSSRVALSIAVGRILRSGPLALATQYWRRCGESFERTSMATLLLAEAEGRWAIRIASPWG